MLTHWSGQNICLRFSVRPYRVCAPKEHPVLLRKNCEKNPKKPKKNQQILKKYMEIQLIQEKKRERNLYLVKVPLCLKGKKFIAYHIQFILDNCKHSHFFPKSHFQIFLTHEINQLHLKKHISKKLTNKMHHSPISLAQFGAISVILF